MFDGARWFGGGLGVGRGSRRLAQIRAQISADFLIGVWLKVLQDWIAQIFHVEVPTGTVLFDPADDVREVFARMIMGRRRKTGYRRFVGVPFLFE